MRIGTAVPSPGGLFEASVCIGGTARDLYRDNMSTVWMGVPAPGQLAYTLRVRNLTPGQIEVISTVDGRNTLRDEPGDTATNRGFIIPAWGEWEFKGWRIDDSQVGEFVFGRPERSVAALATGGITTNVGVIGFAAYRQKPVIPQYPLYPGGQSVAASPGGLTTSMAPAAYLTRGSVGTGIGERRQDQVSRTSFDRSGAPDVLAIMYDTVAYLDAIGVTAGPALPHAPDPFPGEQTGYAKYTR